MRRLARCHASRYAPNMGTGTPNSVAGFPPNFCFGSFVLFNGLGYQETGFLKSLST